MATELIPARVEDRLDFGRLFDFACSQGYEQMCLFLDAMKVKRITHLTLLDCLAEYREWSDAKKFRRMVDDNSEVQDGDKRLRIALYDGAVTVKEIPLELCNADRNISIAMARRD